jgi:GNAT superfamily N-acetyltransferase
VLEETRRRIDGHWARRFGMPIPGLTPVMIGSTGLHDEAALVLLLGDHAYVDAPPGQLDAVASALQHATPADAVDPRRWSGIAAAPVSGIVDHFWADHDTGLVSDVGPLEPDGWRTLAASVGEDAWREAGFDRPAQAGFGVIEDDVVVAAAVVTSLWGWPLDVGVLVRPDARGRGLGSRVARAGLAAAIALSGFAAFRVDRSQAAGRAVALGLGLTPYGSHLSVPLPVG